MKKDTFRSCLEDLYNASLVPIHYLKNRRLQFSLCTYSGDEMNREFFGDIVQEAAQMGDYISMLWNDAHFDRIYYGMLRIRELEFCLLGPCSKEALPFSYIREFKNQKQIQGAEVPRFSEKRVSAVLSLLGTICGEESVVPVNLIRHGKKSDAVSDFLVGQYHLSRSEQGLSHHPYKIEKMVGEYIQEGDAESLLQLIDSIPDEMAGKMSDSALKQAEYGAAISVSLAARYAMEAGVDQFLAYEINDLFLQKISGVRSAEQYQALMKEALVRFARETLLEKEQKTDNLYVKKCKEYIYSHLNKPFQICQIAEELGITPAYLSQIFSEAQRETVKSYLLRKRIEAAQNMLKYSDYDISTISHYFCFNSQSHFCRIFKKYTGKTPSAYRLLNR